MQEIKTLIERWRAGDEQAAAAIYNQFREATFGLAYALLDDIEDAEEVAQDALTYALTHINQYDPHKAKFTTWLHMITVSRCRNKRRRQLLPSLTLFSWFTQGGSLADPAPNPENQAVESARRDEVWEAIQALNQPLREAILLRHWADYTYQEMGEVLGCSLRTAQSRVRLAHRQLGQVLGDKEIRGWKEKV